MSFFDMLAVGGVAPALRIALQAHFGSGVLNCTLGDPEKTKSKRRLDIPLSRPKLFEGYYRPFREWLKEAPDTRRQRVRGRTFRVADFRDIDLSVGLDEGLLNNDPPTADSREGMEHVAEERRGLGRDGILVNVGEIWTAANMRLEPQERRRSRLKTVCRRGGVDRAPAHRPAEAAPRTRLAENQTRQKRVGPKDRLSCTRS